MPADDFKMLKLLTRAAARSATVDGIVDLYYGDSIKLYIKELPKADIGTLVANLFSKPAYVKPLVPGDTPPPIPIIRLATSQAPVLPVHSFQGVIGRPYDFYTTMELYTEEMRTYLQDQDAGKPKSSQLIVSDKNGVWIDITLDLYPNPSLPEESPPISVDPYIHQSDLELALLNYSTNSETIDKGSLNTALTTIQGLPTLTPANREARVAALLSALLTATS